LALRPQHGHFAGHDRPHDGIVDGGVVVGELIAEVNDPSSVRDALRQVGFETQQRVDRLADQDELSLDGGSSQLRCAMRLEVDAGDEALDRRAGLDDIEQ
jgi:hypothetical protein